MPLSRFSLLIKLRLPPPVNPQGWKYHARFAQSVVVAGPLPLELPIIIFSGVCPRFGSLDLLPLA